MLELAKLSTPVAHAKSETKAMRCIDAHFTIHTTGQPSVREGNAWPKRLFDKDELIFRGWYIWHIMGMVFMYNTKSVHCSREQSDRSEM